MQQQINSTQVPANDRGGLTGKSLAMMAAPAALSALSLASWKAGKDIGKIKSNLDKWVKATQEINKDIPIGERNLRQAFAAADTYAAGGRELVRSKILGLPIPYMALRGNLHVSKTLGELQHNGPGGAIGYLANQVPLIQKANKKIWEEITKPERASFIGDMFRPHSQSGWDKRWRASHPEVDGGHYHYKTFYNAPDKEFRNYTRYRKFYGANISDDLKNQLLSAVDDNSLSTLLLKLRQDSPEEFKAVKMFMQNNADYYSGAGVGQGGVAHGYQHLLAPKFTQIDDFLAASRNSTGLAAAGLLPFSITAAREDLSKRAAASDRDLLDEYQYPIGGTLAATGAMTAGSGIKTLRDPLTIGHTWSEVGEHGDGHKNPGKAIYESVQKLKDKYNINSVLLARQADGVVDNTHMPRKFDAFFDTGMGASMPKDWGIQKKNINNAIPGIHDDLRRNTVMHPKVRLGGYMGYVTDLGSSGTPFIGYNETINRPNKFLSFLASKPTSTRDFAAKYLGVKDNYISWINPMRNAHHVDPSAFMRNMREIKVSDKGNPAITVAAMDAMKWSHEAGRTGVIAEALSSTSLSEDQKNLLRNLGNKKLLFVTGSGRGDYVASRLKEYQQAIKKLGLEDQVQLAGMLGRSAGYNPYAQELIKDPSVLTFHGSVPQKLYVGLPGVSDMHDISTGTSALMESAGTPAPLAVTDNWQKIKDSEAKVFPKLMQQLGLSPKVYSAAIDEHNMVNLDQWNHGNRDWLTTRPGVVRAQSAEDKLKYMMSLTPEDYATASKRGWETLRSSEVAKENMEAVINQFLRKRLLLKNLRGGAKAALGLGLLGTGAALPFMTGSEKARAPSLPNSERPKNVFTTQPSSTTDAIKPTYNMDAIRNIVMSNPKLSASAGLLALIGGGYGGYKLLSRKKGKKETGAKSIETS